jgi:hypothetical protein
LPLVLQRSKLISSPTARRRKTPRKHPQPQLRRPKPKSSAESRLLELRKRAKKKLASKEIGLLKLRALRTKRTDGPLLWKLHNKELKKKLRGKGNKRTRRPEGSK